MPIPRDHLPWYSTLQRLVRSGRLPNQITAAVIRAAEVARESAPERVPLTRLQAHVDLRGLPVALRLEAAIAASLDAEDLDAVVRSVFGQGAGEEVSRAIRRGDFQAALERSVEQGAYAAALGGAEPALRSLTARAAAVALEELPRPAGRISRAAVEIRAARAASERAGDLVTRATRESQLAVRELAEQALLEGRDLYRAARSIKQVIGLNRQQAKALDKFALEAQAELLKPKADRLYKSPAGVAQAIERERNRLINHRADTIARTELWQAGQDGQEEVWKEAAESGAMDIRGLGEEFVSKTGERSTGPLLHVFCFCSKRLRAVVIDGVRCYVQEWVVSVRNPCPRCLAFKGARALPN